MSDLIEGIYFHEKISHKTAPLFLVSIVRLF